MSDNVTLTIPADTSYVRLARTMAAAMAAQADLTVDRLEDVRLAVDEAVSQLILDAAPDAQITCTFTVTTDELDVSVSAPTGSGAIPATDTFSWTVLSALVDAVSATAEHATVTLHLRVNRHIAVGA